MFTKVFNIIIYNVGNTFMDSKSYRNNPLFLRNEFVSESEWGFPIVRRQKLNLEGIKLIAYQDTKLHDSGLNRKKGVHFFIDDYRMEGIYRNPCRSEEKLSQYKFVITPDYSTYSNMDRWRQIESVAHSRWCGAYWQSQGWTVIPSVTWSTENNFDFCFNGIEKGCIVAISMIGCKHSKKQFMLGYNQMLNRITPSAIICLGKPFKEMYGNIVTIDYIKSKIGAKDGR